MIEVLKCIFTLFIIYQITTIISESMFPLFKWLRNLNKINTGYFLVQLILEIISELFGCFLCVSVWVGFIASMLLFNISFELGYEHLSWFWSGLFYSALTWFIHLIESKLL